MKQTISGGGVVLNKDGHVLVVNQKGTSWSLPKGKVDPGEDLLQAARREIYEESGVSELDYIKELGTYSRNKIGLNGTEDKDELKTITFFLFTTEQMELDPQDSDNPEAIWLKPEDVEAKLTHPKDKEFYKGIMDEFAHL